jgi:hypothetical protein
LGDGRWERQNFGFANGDCGLKKEKSAPSASSADFNERLAAEGGIDFPLLIFHHVTRIS